MQSRPAIVQSRPREEHLFRAMEFKQSPSLQTFARRYYWSIHFRSFHVEGAVVGASFGSMEAVNEEDDHE